MRGGIRGGMGMRGCMNWGRLWGGGCAWKDCRLNQWILLDHEIFSSVKCMMKKNKEASHEFVMLYTTEARHPQKVCVRGWTGEERKLVKDRGRWRLRLRATDRLSASLWAVISSADDPFTIISPLMVMFNSQGRQENFAHKTCYNRQICSAAVCCKVSI